MQKVRSFFAHVESREDDCPEHGPFVARRIPVPGRELWTDCPICTRQRREQEEEAERKRIHADLSAWRTQQILGQAAIPDRFIGKTLANYKPCTSSQREALEACRNFVEDWETVRSRGECMVLVGKPGTGKTHLAVAIASAILASGYSAVYLRASGIAQAVKESFGSGSQTERGVYGNFAAPDLLVVDEIGRQYGTDSEKHMFFEVLNLRYEKMLPTVLVSNLDPLAFQNFLGSAMLSRVLESGHFVRLDGKNWRLTAARHERAAV